MEGHRLLKAESLTRTIAGRRVVDAVTLEALPGEVLAIMGPSGSGKTSFLRMLNRLDEPSAGRVLLGDVDTRTLNPRQLRRRIGLILQTPQMFPGTVADNLAFGPRQRGVEYSMQQIEQLLERVRLAGYAQRDAERLSGGEAQRVNVLRTLANDPDVLLLDEPTSSLDGESKADVERVIAQTISERNLTCILVTHDPAQARRMAKRIALLVNGRLERIGPTDDILDHTPAAALGTIERSS